MRLVDQTELMMKCFHGNPVPKSLVKLWDVWEDEQDFLVGCCRIRQLITSLDLLMEDYGEQFMKESKDIACNIKAHHQLFERLGFFAITDNQEYLAIDLASSNRDNPPVAILDSEGQYSWLGMNLEEAIYRLAEDYDLGDIALEWLRIHRFNIEQISEPEGAMRFLPSLRKIHEQYYKTFSIAGF
ncbi:hypothetical protein [Brevibacillus sp. SYSU BS000544]|uniref:hypothetical protein n=1 Tax=Brevibacillus sp. SYSU BS000544 TaxID=3416443 RepID=UPI003CE50DFB